MRVIKEEKSVKRHPFMFTTMVPDWKIVKAPNICVLYIYAESSWCKVAEEKTLVERKVVASCNHICKSFIWDGVGLEEKRLRHLCSTFSHVTSP